MVEVTDRAGARLKATLVGAEVTPDLCVRLEALPILGATFRVDKERPGDTTFEFGGRKILVLDEQAAKMYADCELDYTEGKYRFV